MFFKLFCGAICITWGWIFSSLNCSRNYLFYYKEEKFIQLLVRNFICFFQKLEMVLKPLFVFVFLWFFVVGAIHQNQLIISVCDDFCQWLYEGIPFLNQAQEQQLRIDLENGLPFNGVDGYV